MNHHSVVHVRESDQDATPDPQGTRSELAQVVLVGDVVVRRDESGFGIYNYRGERVLDLPMRTASEAERLAAEIVSPWHGRVSVDTGER